jgi:hypothetical protein
MFAMAEQERRAISGAIPARTAPHAQFYSDHLSDDLGLGGDRQIRSGIETFLWALNYSEKL